MNYVQVVNSEIPSRIRSNLSFQNGRREAITNSNTPEFIQIWPAPLWMSESRALTDGQMVCVHVCVSVYKCPSDSDAVEPAYCNSVVCLWLWHRSNRNFFRKMTRRSAPKGRISHIVWLPPYCLTLRLSTVQSQISLPTTLYHYMNMSTWACKHTHYTYNTQRLKQQVRAYMGKTKTTMTQFPTSQV